jgi:hypothetical protein
VLALGACTDRLLVLAWARVPSSPCRSFDEDLPFADEDVPFADEDAVPDPVPPACPEWAGPGRL